MAENFSKYDQALLSSSDLEKMGGYKVAGDHAGAEALRAQYSYSGGGDGSQYIPLEGGKSWEQLTGGNVYGNEGSAALSGNASGGGSAAGYYSPTQYSGANDYSSYVNSLYDSQTQAALKQLEAAYNQNKISLDAAESKIPAQYQDARNQTAAQSAQSRAGFNEYAAVRGLNSGAGGQAQLAMQNTLQGNLGSINRGEADAKSALETERLKMDTAYNDAIAQAHADGDMAKAAALYQEKARYDEAMRAIEMAQSDENYRAWNTNYQIGRDAVSDSRYADELAYNRAMDLSDIFGPLTGDYSFLGGYGVSGDQQDKALKAFVVQNPQLASVLGVNPYDALYSYDAGGAASYGGGGYSSGGGGGYQSSVPQSGISSYDALSPAAQILAREPVITYDKTGNISGLVSRQTQAANALNAGKITQAEYNYILANAKEPTTIRY